MTPHPLFPALLEGLETDRSYGKNVPEKHKVKCYIPSLTPWKMQGGGGLAGAVACAQNMRWEGTR